MNIKELGSIFLEHYENKRSNLKIALFLGAGTDISSGGVTFLDLKIKFCSKYSEQRISEETPLELLDNIFNELLIQSIDQQNRGHIVDQLFNELATLEPSDSYKILALLIRYKVIDAIITTNFDSMLERAAQSLGLVLFQIFSPGISKPYGFDFNVNSTLIPYLKLHGDISTRSNLVLAQKEVVEGKYDPAITKLLKNILHTHTLVIVGYSGYDPVIAEIIGNNIDNDKCIYYCNPHKLDGKSPLSEKLKGRKLRFIQASFDKLIDQIAEPILKKPSLLRHSPTLIKNLLKWKLEYFRDKFYNEHLTNTFLKIQDRPIPRQEAEGCIRNFLLSDLPLLIISGKSGVGKSILGINACNWSKKQGNVLYFFINAKNLDRPELDIYIAESLGGIGSEAASILFNIEDWLYNNNHQLIVFLDGLNEFSSSIDSCVNLLRNVLRFLIQLNPKSPIKVMLTIREEIWHKVYHYVDQVFLSKILAPNNSNDKAYSLISLDKYSNDEFNEALTRLSSTDLTILDRAGILTGYDQLRDPFFLNTVYNHTGGIDKNLSFFKIFEYSIQEKLTYCSRIIHPAILSGILSNIAYQCLSTNKSFNLTNFYSQQHVSDIEDILLDLGIISKCEMGTFRFTHDRFHEYFLSKAFGFADVPDISRIETLIAFLGKYQDDALAIAAARMFFLLNEEFIDTIQKGFLHCNTNELFSKNSDRENFISFIKDVLIELSINNPDLLNTVLTNILHGTGIDNLLENQIRSLILIIVHLPKEKGLELYRKISTNRKDLSSIESEIFFTDYIVEFYLSNCKSIMLLYDLPFSNYFNDPEIPDWKKLKRFFSFIGRLGSFNLNKDEYSKLTDELEISLSTFLSTFRITEGDCNDFSEYILKFCNRLFFNASKQEIICFFKQNKKENFISIFEHLEEGGTLDLDIYKQFKPYISRVGNNCEFHLCKLAFILSSKNNFELTINLWKTIFQSFNESTPPEEVDFLQATLLYLFVVNNIPYTEDFNEYFEKILNDWPVILEHTPGLMRSRWRNLENDFDLIFEDGFNPIASYIYLRPTIFRRSVSYEHYKTLYNIKTINIDSLFMKYLIKFLDEGEISKVLRIIHAICSHIMLWPEDGFSYLPIIAKSNNILVRQAYIRVLAESYHRYPIQTLNYLRIYGSNLSEEEIMKIKIRLDPHIGYRQIEDLEWANIIQFLLHINSEHRKTFYEILKKVIMCTSLPEAVYKVFDILDLSKRG